MFNKPSKTSSASPPTSPPSSYQPTKHPRSCFPTSASMSSTFMTPRHADLDSSYPAAFFGKKRTPPPTTPSTVDSKAMLDADRRTSVDSTATTATSSSVSSATSTIAAEKEMAKKWMAEAQQQKESKGKQQQKQFDVFDYQTAGYLSMPMDHEAQPYRNSASASASAPASSSRKGSSSSTSSSSKSHSLWQKTKNLTQRRSSEEKQQAKKGYEESGLEKKTKFGMTEAGMRIVG